MKKILTSVAAAIICTLTLSAQNVAFINTEKILNSIPEYTEVQDELSQLSDKYKSAIETEVGKIETLYQKYQNSKASMTASQRKVAEDEIISKEKVVKEKQQIYFGEEGIMAKKSEELLTPIKNKVEKAVNYVIEQEGSIDMVIDVAAATGIYYYKESKDLTEKVIKVCKLINQ